MSRDAFDLFTPRDRGRFGDNEAREPQSVPATPARTTDTVTLDLTYRDETPLSIGVSAPSSVEWKWLPKSETKIRARKGALISVTIPQWLAQDRGLI